MPTTPRATSTTPSPEERLDRARKANTYEAYLFMTKAFRGEVDVAERGEGRKLAAAITSLSNDARIEQTISAREQFRGLWADKIAVASGMSYGEALQLTMPEHPVAVALAPKKVES